MTARIEYTDPARAKLKIQVPAGFVTERYNAYFGQIAKRAKIPGFRPGKAPKDVIKKMYAEDTQSELSERLISEFLWKTIQEHQLKIVLPPVLIATDKPTENKEFNFEVEVDLKPELPKVQLKDIVVEDIPSVPVTDEIILEELKNLQEADANFTDIKEVRVCRGDDCAVVRYEGRVDGLTLEKLKAESQTVLLGKQQFLPDFEAGIVGMSRGEEKTIDVRFPENYHEEDLRNKTVKFQLTLLEIKEKVLPALDDEFAKGVDPQIESLEELKAKLKRHLEMQNEFNRKAKLREKIGDALVAKYPLEVSPRQVRMMAENLAQRAHHRLHQMGVKHEDTKEHFDALIASSMKRAERDIRLSYLLESIAEEQNIEVTEDDLEKRFQETAERTRLSLPQIRQYYSQHEEGSETPRIESLKIDILDEKSLDYALSAATIKNEGLK